MSTTIERVHEGLSRIRPGVILASGLLTVVLITWVDMATREAFDLSHFYLVPLYPITWFVGLFAGLLTAALIALSWCIVELRVDAGMVSSAVIVWNSVADFALYALFCVGISSLKKLHYELQAAAETDPLTGAANRRHFYRAVKDEISRNKRYGACFSLVYFDLDNFKAVNDTHGHNTGDELLSRTVSTLQTHSRDIDVVARLGGDEFAVLLPGTGQDAVQSYVAKLRPLVNNMAAEHQWPVTCSIGVITCTASPESVESLIARVDALMYAVKQSGKDNVAFSSFPDMANGD